MSEQELYMMSEEKAKVSVQRSEVRGRHEEGKQQRRSLIFLIYLRYFVFLVFVSFALMIVIITN